MEEEDYSGWSLRDRLELLAFEARLAGLPLALVTALWEALDRLDSSILGRRRSPQEFSEHSPAGSPVPAQRVAHHDGPNVGVTNPITEE
jgi:hypothetical protein